MQSATATRNQYRTQQRIQKEALADLRRIWRDMPAGGDWNRAWDRISPDLVGAVSEAQLKMATETTSFLNDFLEEVDLADRPTAAVREVSLAGFTSDGQDLEGLLYGGVVHARVAGAEQGLSGRQALVEGLSWLGPVIASQISDVGRTATMLGTATRPNLAGYTRFLNPPSCQRCAVLAGRTYRYSTGFARHPRCDCLMVPAASTGWAKSEGFVFDPTADLSLIKDLSRAQRAAIEAGADLSQVVNARKGMSFVGEGASRRQITSSGTTKTGVFGRAEIERTGQFTEGRATARGLVSTGRSRTTTARLTPQQIAKQARNRDEFIDYLRRYRYIVDKPVAGAAQTTVKAAREALAARTAARSAKPSTAGAGGGGRTPPSSPRAAGAAPDPDPSDKVAWKARQDATGVDFKGEILYPHEVRFVERFIAAGHSLEWIATGRHIPTNDFLWLSNGGIPIELKSTKAKYSTIRGRILETVVKAERQNVVKANFIIDLADQALTSELRTEIASYNVGREKYRIERLWVMSRGQIEEIRLAKK